MVYNVAVDGGNSSLKILVEGNKRILIPNVMADASSVDYRINENHKGGTGRNKLDISIVTHYDKGVDEKAEDRFLLGTMAEAYQARNRANTDKSKDIDLVNAMLSGIAFALYRYKEENNEDIGRRLTLRVNLATGLPYHEWQNEKTKEEYANKLTGNHLIKFNHPFFHNLEVELIIERTLVLIEGESILNLIFADEENEFTKMEKNELIDSIAVGVDLGAYTSEITAKQFFLMNDEDEYDDSELEIGLRTMPNLTKGIPMGVGHAMEKTIADIQKNENVDKLIRRDIERAFSKLGKKDGKIGHLVGSGIYIADYFKPHAESFAKEIGKELYGLYNTENVKNKVKKIFIAGGGSKIEPIVNEFKEVLINDGYNSQIIVTLSDPDPVFGNCYGYYIKLRELVDYFEAMENDGE